MNNILITSAGRRVELVGAWKKSAKKLFGPEVKVFANDLSPSLSAACQVADQCFEILRCTDPGFPETLLKQCLDHRVGLVIPTIDTELLALAEARSRFDSAGVQIVVSDPSLICQCRDKRFTANLFKTLSINTPAILDPKNLTFPCFLKPISGSSSQGAKPIFTSDDLCQSDMLKEDNLFQELIPIQWIEYTADLYYSKSGDLQACVPRQRLETRGGEISKGITRKDKVFHFLNDHFYRLNGARGVITCQIFTDPSRENVLGIEINPRFGGGYPMSHAAGVDYPGMLMREYLLDEILEKNDEWQSDLLLLRHDAMVVSETSSSVLIP